MTSSVPTLKSLTPLILEYPNDVLLCVKDEGMETLTFYSDHPELHEDFHAVQRNVIMPDGQEKTFHQLIPKTYEGVKSLYSKTIMALKKANERQQKIERIVGAILVTIGILIGLSIAVFNPPSAVAYLLTFGGIVPVAGGGIMSIGLGTQDNPKIKMKIVELQEALAKEELF